MTVFNFKMYLEAKKSKSPEYGHSPTSEGFFDECVRKNKDKDDPEAYCASIKDKAHGRTTWRGESSVNPKVVTAAEKVQVTEGQLSGKGGYHPRTEKEPTQITQEQLEAQREGEAETVTEKQLEKVRKAASASPWAIFAAKKDETNLDLHTEVRLRSKPVINDEPGTVTQDQLEDQREGEPEALTEKQLDKARTGSAEALTEGLLDKSGSKLVKHRNPDAHMGNINKLEEQRLARDDRQEKEKYKPANSAPKGARFLEKKPGKGDDDLRLAKTAGKWDMWGPEDYEGFGAAQGLMEDPTEGVDITDLLRDKEQEEAVRGERGPRDINRKKRRDISKVDLELRKSRPDLFEEDAGDVPPIDVKEDIEEDEVPGAPTKAFQEFTVGDKPEGASAEAPAHSLAVLESSDPESYVDEATGKVDVKRLVSDAVAFLASEHPEMREKISPRMFSLTRAKEGILTYVTME